MAAVQAVSAGEERVDLLARALRDAQEAIDVAKAVYSPSPPQSHAPARSGERERSSDRISAELSRPNPAGEAALLAAKAEIQRRRAEEPRIPVVGSHARSGSSPALRVLSPRQGTPNGHSGRRLGGVWAAAAAAAARSERLPPPPRSPSPTVSVAESTNASPCLKPAAKSRTRRSRDLQESHQKENRVPLERIRQKPTRAESAGRLPSRPQRQVEQPAPSSAQYNERAIVWAVRNRPRPQIHCPASPTAQRVRVPLRERQQPSGWEKWSKIDDVARALDVAAS